MNAMKQALTLIGVAVLLGAAVNLFHPERMEWLEDWGRRVEAQAVREGIPVVYLADMIGFLRDGSRLFVDARPADRFAAGHLPGAVSVPPDALDRGPDAPPVLPGLDRPPVIYCDGPECDDALRLALHLRAQGRSDVAVFIGGMELWQAELLDTEGEAGL